MGDTDAEFVERPVCRNCGVHPTTGLYAIGDAEDPWWWRGIACECTRLESMNEIPDYWVIDDE